MFSGSARQESAQGEAPPSNGSYFSNHKGVPDADAAASTFAASPAAVTPGADKKPPAMDKAAAAAAFRGAADPISSASSSSSKSHNTASPRVNLASLRTVTMFEARHADAENKHRPIDKWRVPERHYGTGRRPPRAATLFLGKDHERWMQYERERMGDGTGALGLRLAWRQGGTASTIQVGQNHGFSDGDEGLSDGDEGFSDDDETEEDDEEDDGLDSTAATTRDSGFDDDRPLSAAGSSAGESSRRGSEMSHRRASSSRGSKGQAGSARFPRLKQGQSDAQRLGRRGSSSSRGRRRSSGAGSSREGSVSGASSTSRPRRFSSNGPEAAFLRHETVIGIHTPRRESLASVTSGYERVSLAPLSQIRSPSSSSSNRRRGSSGSPRGSVAQKALEPPADLKPSASSELLMQAANAAAAAVAKTARRRGSTDPITSEDEETSIPGTGRRRQGASPRVALKLARRRKPIKVDGTLYDRSGPFREGAVTDGLCVRFFTAEDASENMGYDAGTGSASELGTAIDQAVADDDMVPTTFLITTPDNRVSSAAKLRRWAMDGDGRFFAAMEIKSLEAKMRAADPASSVSKAQMRELRDRFLDDLLDEVQKAETLNPDRKSVARVLCTSDNKYVRLEEDYPEEAFFVVAGCDDAELYPVVALVFSQAIRHIIRFHSAGWLHGDIKLENLMFDEEGQLVVIDYENANPFRGVPDGDGRVTLASYDWVPPEAYPGPRGRRAGPSADLWALGCNMIRAFALRDGVEDVDIRDTLLGKGQESFLAYRRQVLLGRGSGANASRSGIADSSTVNSRRGSDVGIPGSKTRPLPTAADVDLTLLQSDSDNEDGGGGGGGSGKISTDDDGSTPLGAFAAASEQSRGNGIHPVAGSKLEQQQPPAPPAASQTKGPPTAGPSPHRLLSRFAREAPDLLRLVLARCISDLPEERSIEAELECLRFVEALESEESKRGAGSTLGVARRAVKVAIDLSGSAWVRPKLDDARLSLGLT